MINVDGLTVRYRSVTVLHEVSTRFDGGELVYLLGRNGAGKSTLLRSIAGMVRPSAGVAVVDGRELRDYAEPAAMLGIHLGADAAGSPTGPNPTHTGRRHLRWLAAAAGAGGARVDRVLRQVGLADAADRAIVDYSLGMRQRLGIAAALLTDAPNVIFDEPVNGLDIDGIRWLRGLLRGLAEEGRTVVIASHLFDEVMRTGDRVVVLDGGRVAADALIGEFIGAHTDLESAYIALIRPAKAVR